MGVKVDHSIELSKYDDVNHFASKWSTTGVVCDKAGKRQKMNIVMEVGTICTMIMYVRDGYLEIKILERNISQID